MDTDKFYELVHKYIRRDMTAEESNALDQELAHNDEHRLIFDALTKSSRQKTDKHILDQKVDQILAQGRVTTKEQAAVSAAKTSTPFYRRLIVQLAAAAALIAVLSYVAYQHNYQAPVEMSDEYNIVFTTKKGERKRLTLTDGTEVWLNGGSTIQLKPSYGHSNRAVKLTGEAFFDVKRNPDLPMIIDTRDLSVRVIGTSFNMRSYADERLSETSLIEGKIELSVKKADETEEKYLLAPGEKVKVLNRNFHSKAAVASKSVEKPAIKVDHLPEVVKVGFMKADEATSPTEIAWKNNTLAFDAEPLERAVSKMEKWFNTPIVTTKASLANLKITGTFQQESLEQVLDMLILGGVKIKYRKENGIIYIH